MTDERAWAIKTVRPANYGRTVLFCLSFRFKNPRDSNICFACFNSRFMYGMPGEQPIPELSDQNPSLICCSDYSDVN